MRITATRCGSFVPHSGSAAVFSVHDRVINLTIPTILVDASRSNEAQSPSRFDLLLSLVRGEDDLSDLAIEVPALPRVGRGGTVVWGPSTAHSEEALFIDTGTVDLWDGTAAPAHHTVESVFHFSAPAFEPAAPAYHPAESAPHHSAPEFETAAPASRLSAPMPNPATRRRPGIPPDIRSVLTVELERTGRAESFRGVVLERDENPFVARARRLLTDEVTTGAAADDDAAARDHSATKDPAAGDAAAIGAAALAKLIGLGVGFTPSGDDFVAGVLLAGRLFPELNLLRAGAAETQPGTETQPGARAEPGTETQPRDRAEPKIHGETLRELFEARLDTTTAGGRTLLWLALRGHFPAYLLRFAAAVAEVAASDGKAGYAGEQGAEADGETLASGDRLHRPLGAAMQSHLQTAARRAFFHGETSGIDAVSGFVWALGRHAAVH